MDEYITDKCIVDEYLNNWFTREELAEYLCIDVSRVNEVLDNVSDKRVKDKIGVHTRYISRYYEEMENPHEPFVTDENEIFIEIAKYMIENHASLRDTAEAFGLGKTTVYDYVHERLPGISIILYKQVFDVLNENKSFSTNNRRVIEQVLTCYNMLMSGKSSEEIGEELGLGRNVVQRNLSGRLKKIDGEKFQMAEMILHTYRSKGYDGGKFVENVQHR